MIAQIEVGYPGVATPPGLHVHLLHTHFFILKIFFAR